MFGRGRINNKEKKAASGNWGHPRKYTKRHTKIDDPLIQDKGIGGVKKKKEKKEKKPYICVYHCCPFCDTELPLISNANEKLYFLSDRIKKCPKCGAKEVDECPACKNKTWLVDGIYKHQNWGCGFNGKKLNRKG